LPRQIHWGSVLQFAFSAMAALLALSSSLGLALLGLLGMGGQAAAGAMGGVELLMLAASSFVTGLLLLPSAWFSLMRLVGREEISQAAARLRLPPLIWLILLGVTILSGYAVTRLQAPWVYLLPPLHASAVVLTATWFFAIGSRGLALGSRQRFWGVLGSGLVFGPLLILIVEVAFLSALGILAIFSLAANQSLLQQLIPLLEQVQISPEATEDLFNLLQPYLASPMVIYIILAFGAGLVPLVEELFKPVGVWLLSGRRLSAVEGFVLGMLSGAGYAIFESLSLTINSEDWAALVISRGGTTLLHIVTTGLVGWGLAVAIQRGKYVKMVLAYLAAVLLHGTWNALSLISTSGILLVDELPPSSMILQIGKVAPYGLVGLALFLFALLLVANRYFASQAPPVAGEPVDPGVAPQMQSPIHPMPAGNQEYNGSPDLTSAAALMDETGEKPNLRDTHGVD
jgi:hypothetical protein